MKRLTLDNSIHLAKKKGGKCLSKIYKNARSPMKWECEKSHQWEAPYDSIQSGRWCPKCANQNRNSDSKLGIKKMHEVAKKNNGRCLSKEYINNATGLLWECHNGHQWKNSPANIIKGQWCRKCGQVERSREQTLGIDLMKSIAKDRGGRCMSNEYQNAHTFLKWSCSKGHEWQAKPMHIRKGSWCPECNGKKPDTIETFQKIAKNQGGQCLSKAYINQKSKLEFQCKVNHTWTTSAASVKNGSWCKRCSAKVSNSSRKLSISSIQLVASSRNGTLLSENYENNATPLLWRCEANHEFKMPFSKVYSGQWCPKCASGFGERIVKVVIEAMTGHDFPKTRPEWLKGIRGASLELDGYCEELKLAFEHQGEQHYSTQTHLY